MDLFEKLKNNLKHRKLIVFPGVEGEQVNLKLLSSSEQQQAELAAAHWLENQAQPLTISTADVLESEIAKQVLWRAVREPSTDKPLFKTVDQLRESLSVEVTELLSREYQAFERELSPVRGCKTEDDFTKLAEEVKKKPKATISNIYDLNLLRRLIITLAARQAK